MNPSHSPGSEQPSKRGANHSQDDSASPTTVAVPLVATIGWAITLVVATAVYDGISLATRAATALVMPFGCVWLGLIALTIASVRCRRCGVGNGLARLLPLVLLLVVTIAGNGWVSGRLISLIEWPETPVGATPDVPYRVAIVLGGGVSINATGTAELGADGERVASAAQLWHAGLVQSIICTGTDATGQFHPRDTGRDLLVSLGVPDRVIYGVEGLNTSQEMRSIKAFFDSPPAGFPPTGSDVLITSAFHMRRAMRLAKGQGLKLEPHPACFRSGLERFTPAMIIPSPGATENFARVFKECLAWMVGR